MKLIYKTIMVLAVFACHEKQDNGVPTNDKNRVVNFFPNGNVKEIKYFRDSMLNGECFWFYPSGILEQKVRYIDNKINGHVYFFYQSGALKTHRFYVDGKPFGYAAEYFDDTVGMIKNIMIFRDGKLSYRKEFDSLGKVIKEEGQN